MASEAGADGLDDRYLVQPVLKAMQVLQLVCEGKPNKLIAYELDIAETTVKAHLTRVYERIGVSDRTQAALWAQRQGIGPGAAQGTGA